MNAKLLNNLALVETSDGSATLFSTEYQQTYHSKHGALNECEHIYLHASGVFERLQAGKITRLLEVGFGTGLNFLVTAALARKSCTALQYWAIEKNWVPEKQFAELNYGRHFPKLHDVWSAFSTMQPALLQENIARFHFEPNIELTILFGDATILDIPLKNFHAVYHDAFSPEANPELWTADFFQKIKESCEEERFFPLILQRNQCSRL